MPDCETLRYSITLQEREKINREAECVTGSNIYNYVTKKIKSNAYGGGNSHSGFKYNFHARVSNQIKMDNPISSIKRTRITDTYKEFCRKFCRYDFAIVKIRFASNVYTKSKFELKTTFVERFATFGKSFFN